MIDALIVHPNASRRVYGKLADDLTAIEPPIWCRIIAAYLRDRGFRVVVLDMEALGIGAESLPEIIAQLHPRLAVIVAHGHQPSASTQTMVAVPEIAKTIENCGIRSIVIGGHASALPEQTFGECGATYVCDGEGPLTIEALLNRCPEEHAPGLVWRGGRNKPARLLYAESEMEGRSWDLLDMRAYRAHGWQCFGGWQRAPYASIYTSFGCPFFCSFCMINTPFHANAYRARNPKRVVDEIIMLHDVYGVHTFKIADEMFVLKPSHYRAICQGIIDAGIGNDINIWAYARVDTVKAEDLDLLRRSGICWLALGIESADEYVREGASKALRNDDVIGVVRRVQAAGINVIGNYIFGLPNDNIKSMEATLALALECRTEFANFYSAMAYPGSKLYREAVAQKRTLPVSWSGYSQHSYDCVPLGNDALSAADILRFRDEGFDLYFSDADYLAMIENKFGAETLGHIKEMTKIKLRRQLLEAKMVAA